jgi:Predicted metal-binding, possibly nucleic acid-binding protein
MLSQLPEQADPRRLCEQGKRYEGRVALQDLARLAPLLTSTEGEAAFTLAFDHDETKRPRVRGTVRAELQLCCQRCLQSMPLVVDAAFQLSPVSGPEEAERLPAEYEPLLLDERLLHPMDLVEDELILAIPPAPRHAAADCGVDMADYRQEPVPEAPQREENPFAALQVLKRDNEE